MDQLTPDLGFRENLTSGNIDNDGVELFHRILGRSNIPRSLPSFRRPAGDRILFDRAGTSVIGGESDAKRFSRTISPVRDFRFSTPTDPKNESPPTDSRVRNDAEEK